VGPENRVKGFLLVAPLLVRGSHAASLGKHLGKSVAYDENASGSCLAGVLEGHGAGQGFTGVFDTATGRVALAPSTADAVIPQGWVARAGGHADVSAALGGDPVGHAGFAAILEEGGGLRLTWRSGTLNQGAGNLVPQGLRQAIVDAVEAATGRKVVSFCPIRHHYGRDGRGNYHEKEVGRRRVHDEPC
jgi:hypothetical protein